MKKYKIYIYGAGSEYNSIITIVNMLHSQLEVIAVVTTYRQDFQKIDGYACVTAEEVDWELADYIIVAAGDWKNILHTLVSRGVDEKKIISSSVFKIPFFDLEKYIAIRNNLPTILANTCLGGMIYNELALPFNSPTIAMVCEGKSYIRFLSDPEYNLGLTMEKDDRNCLNDVSVLQQHGYPVGRISKDIYWYFVHSSNVTESINEWNQRRKRINKDNIFALMIIENDEDAFRFNELNIEHKLGFYYKDLGLECVMYIPGWENYSTREKYNWYFRNLVQDTVTNTFESNRPSAIDWIRFLNKEKNYRRF